MTSVGKNGLTLKDLEARYSKAAKAELNRELDLAFRLYIDVAQDFLHLSRTTGNAAIRTACRTHAGKALDRAEKIKKVKRDVTPVVVDHFSEQEQFSVLRNSSVINGTRFPLWSDPVGTRNDAVQPALSPEQIQNHATWRRLEHTTELEGASLAPHHIIQHMVSDCSVCAAIAVCIEHDRRFGSKLGLSSLHTIESGRYDLKVFFNGSDRRIDDQLPCYLDGRLMCLSTRPEFVLWPSLLEKAYMKLVGSYDFPGSNSATDLSALIGWIPEHIEMKSSHFEKERTWERLVSGFKNGTCVLTVGTGERLPNPELSPMELLPAHCYAVIDVVEDENGRRMAVLDSRVQHISHSEAVEELNLEQLSLDDSRERSRSYGLSWDSVCYLFDGIYLNWNPIIFSHNLTFHGKWRREEDSRGEPRHFRATVRVDEPSSEEEFWILLIRHVVDSSRRSEYISLSAQSQAMSDTSSSYLKGSYTDSTHILAKAQCSPLSSEISIVASYDGDYDDVGFTINVYSSRPISWIRERTKWPYTKKVTGAFTSKSAGGNPTNPTFMNNPQYRLRLSSISTSRQRKKLPIELTVQSDRHIPVNVTVAWADGGRVTDLTQNEIATSSGPYSYGFAYVTKELPAGDYTVIVSAFDPQILGAFSLDVGSTQQFELDPIPHEGDGMICKIIRDSWTTENAAGGPSFNKYAANPVYELKLVSPGYVKIRLQLEDTRIAAPINVTLFDLRDDDLLGNQLATSGKYTDALSGVATSQVFIRPGTFAIVPSTYSSGILATFKLIVYTSATGSVVVPRRKSVLPTA